MQEQTEKLYLGDLKCRKYAMREKFLAEGWTYDEEAEYKDVVRKLKWVESIVLPLIIVCLLLLSGCTASVGGGASASAYYPRNWESPESREQHTQPTMGMARNNLPMVGGN